MFRVCRPGSVSTVTDSRKRYSPVSGFEYPAPGMERSENEREAFWESLN